MQAYGEGCDIPNGKSQMTRPGVSGARSKSARSRKSGGGAGWSFWLPDRVAGRLAEDEWPEKLTGCVEPSREGRWPVGAAVPEVVAANVSPRPPFTPCRSRLEHGFGEKIFAAMRYGVSGHLEHMLHQK